MKQRFLPLDPTTSHFHCHHPQSGLSRLPEPNETASWPIPLLLLSSLSNLYFKCSQLHFNKALTNILLWFPLSTGWMCYTLVCDLRTMGRTFSTNPALSPTTSLEPLSLQPCYLSTWRSWTPPRMTESFSCCSISLKCPPLPLFLEKCYILYKVELKWSPLQESPSLAFSQNLSVWWDSSRVTVSRQSPLLTFSVQPYVTSNCPQIKACFLTHTMPSNLQGIFRSWTLAKLFKYISKVPYGFIFK